MNTIFIVITKRGAVELPLIYFYRKTAFSVNHKRVNKS